MADSYDSYITLKSESVATKSMISNLNSEDEELNHSMGLHLDGSSPIWSNIGNQTTIDSDDISLIEQAFHQFSQCDTPLSLRHYILLDSQSTVHAFCNETFVEEVQECYHKTTLVGNGGKITFNQQCSIHGLHISQPVWFHEDYVTNVLSPALLKQQRIISYDSKEGDSIIFHREPTKADLDFCLLHQMTTLHST